MSAYYKIVLVFFIKQSLIYENQLGGPRQDKYLVKWSLMTKRLRTTGLVVSDPFCYAGGRGFDSHPGQMFV